MWTSCTSCTTIYCPECGIDTLLSAFTEAHVTTVFKQLQPQQVRQSQIGKIIEEVHMNIHINLCLDKTYSINRSTPVYTRSRLLIRHSVGASAVWGKLLQLCSWYEYVWHTLWFSPWQCHFALLYTVEPRRDKWTTITYYNLKWWICIFLLAIKYFLKKPKFCTKFTHISFFCHFIYSTVYWKLVKQHIWSIILVFEWTTSINASALWTID